MLNNENTRCGYVAIVGRPNVGKSTLLNHILGEKLSITSRKPQTTRHRLLGIKTLGWVQTIYVDTPGMHLQEPYALNQYMNQEALRALNDVDAVVFVVDGLQWTPEDQAVFERVSQLKCPVILAVNKIDTLSEKTELLPLLGSLSEKFNFFEIIPISAKRKINLDHLEKALGICLPHSPHYFPETQLTDKGFRFRIAEIIREKLVRILGQELPYTTTVEIETYHTDTMARISAIIWVEREGQKPIVIGKKGERLKEIGIRSRADIEKMLRQKVVLKLWVKVRQGWSNDVRALKSLGYGDFSEE
jgi:GTPase